jgi:hypothetical protein
MEDEQDYSKLFMNRQEERESEGEGGSGVLTAGRAEHGSRCCFLPLARGSRQRTAKEGREDDRRRRRKLAEAGAEAAACVEATR